MSDLKFPRAHARVGRGVWTLPNRGCKSVPLHLDTALNEHCASNRSGRKARLFKPFLAIGGVCLRLDTHQGMRSARERTNRVVARQGEQNA